MQAVKQCTPAAWSFGHHSEQNQRAHMEDRLTCVDLTEDPAFTGCRLVLAA